MVNVVQYMKRTVFEEYQCRNGGEGTILKTYSHQKLGRFLAPPLPSQKISVFLMPCPGWDKKGHGMTKECDQQIFCPCSFIKSSSSIVEPSKIFAHLRSIIIIFNKRSDMEKCHKCLHTGKSAHCVLTLL